MLCDAPSIWYGFGWWFKPSWLGMGGASAFAHVGISGVCLPLSNEPGFYLIVCLLACFLTCCLFSWRKLRIFFLHANSSSLPFSLFAPTPLFRLYLVPTIGRCNAAKCGIFRARVSLTRSFRNRPRLCRRQFSRSWIYLRFRPMAIAPQLPRRGCRRRL